MPSATLLENIKSHIIDLKNTQVLLSLFYFFNMLYNYSKIVLYDLSDI